MTDIVAVNREQRFAVTDHGDICPIIHFFDTFGDDTDDPFEAVVAVAKLDDDNWFSINLARFTPVTVN